MTEIDAKLATDNSLTDIVFQKIITDGTSLRKLYLRRSCDNFCKNLNCVKRLTHLSFVCNAYNHDCLERLGQLAENLEYLDIRGINSGDEELVPLLKGHFYKHCSPLLIARKYAMTLTDCALQNSEKRPEWRSQNFAGEEVGAPLCF